MSLIKTTNHRKDPRRFQKETVLEIAEKKNENKQFNANGWYFWKWIVLD